MVSCTHCANTLRESDRFCPSCGTRVYAPAQLNAEPQPKVTFLPPETHHHSAARGFSQLYGLDPRIAFLTLIIDLMLNAGDLVTLGLLVPFSIAAGVVLGYIAYRAQINWYGDDKESAKIKGIILGLLTAIPTPLPAILYIPSGLLGLFHNLRRKLHA